MCCIGQTAQCTQSCGNLDFVWACDRSAHCGGAACCFTPLFGDFTTCPGRAGAVAPSCKSSCASNEDRVCQTDADCNDGQTCYAVFIDLGDAASRTIGLCR
jgi:hypothetical protein